MIRIIQSFDNKHHKKVLQYCEIINLKIPPFFCRDLKPIDQREDITPISFFKLVKTLN